MMMMAPGFVFLFLEIAVSFTFSYDDQLPDFLKDPEYYRKFGPKIAGLTTSSRFQDSRHWRPGENKQYGQSGSARSVTPSVLNSAYIDPTTPTNITVIKGKTAILACVVKNVGTASVSFMRVKDINILTMNEYTNIKDPRIRSIHVPGTDRWALRIQETEVEDSGEYECQVTTSPEKTIVLINLNVLDPKTEILGPKELFLSVGSTLNLTCVISGGPQRQPFIMWTHQGKILKYISPEDEISSTSSTSTSTPDPSSTELFAMPTFSSSAYAASDSLPSSKQPSSPLRADPSTGAVITRVLVQETDGSHSGRYQCEPGDAPNAEVLVHVLDGKLPAAMQSAPPGVRPAKLLQILSTIFVLIFSKNFQELELSKVKR